MAHYKRRRLRRDVAERGRTTESVIDQYLTTVRPAHEQFIEPSKRYADVIIPQGGLNRPAIDVLLARVRGHRGNLTRAAFLSARNDAVANVAIIVAGLVTAATRSVWPDVIVGLGIAALNADAAREVYAAARAERRAESA